MAITTLPILAVFVLTAAAMSALPAADSFAFVTPPSPRSSDAVVAGKCFDSALPGADDENHEAVAAENDGDTRRAALGRILASSASVVAFSALSPMDAAIAADDVQSPKQTNLSDEDILKIVVDKDLVANQFLVNGRLTRSIYDESCAFQDEIDTYGLDQWMKGTAKLFDGERSKVVVAPGSVQAKGNVLQFRFVEYLCFNIPLVKPIVYLSGTLFLTRSESTGLITSYREKWDQDIYKVLTSESKLFTSSLSQESLDSDLDAFFAANANP
mmetsp:Transcript_23437/g.49892  ORF Transcript_23437/g.49892 Transcript_23437/m.49892 type:complete len:271 (+) Transcript_23437:131-943(+)|eukprot:CAMPEP_0201135346 /NCGR_PEP_ID=MMETSP0850-20130426/54263_1 /ASSEMBLY_ACC=CAM_ASM_000622 /TAXON_ID=183588 /ORGANISM="Pseudo-nitzschia fraudulenta, Strain WWA7" /LENGTH=270 /DNA_ID=CAMNT_0047406505 /DNA_START=105 /DNA_END=917 /DNA_ORIENTATION=+